MIFGEYTPDLPDINHEGLTVCNARPIAGGYRAFPSSTVTSAALDTKVYGFFSGKDDSANIYRYCATAGGKLYKRTTAADWTQANTGMTPVFPVEFAKWGNTVIQVNGNTDAPQVITFGGSAFAALGGSPPKAKHIGIVKDFVVLGNVNDGTVRPERLVWSATGSSTGWTAGTNQSDTQDLFDEGGKIQRIMGGDYGTIFKEKSIWHMTYEGSPTVFRFDVIETDRGTIAPASVIKNGGNYFYLAEDGFYYLVGTQSIPIGANKINKTFLANLDTNLKDQVVGCLDPANTMAIWIYPYVGGGYRAVIYNWAINRWGEGHTVAGGWIMANMSTGYDMDTAVTAYQGNLDLLTISLDSPFWQGGAYVLSGFDTLFREVTYASSASDALTLTTGYHELTPNRRTFLSGIRPLVDTTYSSPSIRIYTKDRANATVANQYLASEASDGIHNTRIDSRYFKMEMQLTTTGMVTGADIEAVPSGAR